METLSKIGPKFGICLLALSCYAWAQTPGTIATFAGNGYYRPPANPTGDGSPATSVALQTPDALAVDASGNLYIVDKNDNRVRKVDASSGIITTVAGNGTAGFSGDGGPATSAQLDSPIGVAVDTPGNLYIVDSVNNRIRKVDTSGQISTFAGNGAAPPATPTPADPIGDGGQATSAELNNPSSVAVDTSGNVYITDQSHRIVRKVNTSGIITTVAGVENTQGYSGDGGPATSAQLDSPKALAVDASGNLYIADQYGYRIRKVDTTGTITTIAGNGVAGFTGDGGPAAGAQLNAPAGLAVDASGNLYITDQGNIRIRKIDTTGKISTVAGNGTASPAGGDGPQNLIGDGGPATSAPLSQYVAGIVVSSNYLYIADFGDDAVRRVNLTAATVQVTLASDTPGASFVVSGTGCEPGTYPAPKTLTWATQPQAACSVTVTVPSGYSFSAWADGPTANPRTFNAPASNTTYTAHFGGSIGICSYALSATTAGFLPAADDGSVTVTAPAGCTWTAISNASWLTVTAGANGTGNGTVSFHVDVNSGSSARTGTLTIGGQTMTVTQAGTSVTSPTALRFVPVTPCRVADTRDNNGPFGGPLLSGQTTRDFAIPQSACGIPANAQAYSLNFTVVPPSKLTYLTVFPTGQPQPVASTLNSFDGRIKANAAMVPAGTNGAVSVFATDDTQLIIDINGYFVPASTASAIAFYPLAPCRLVDTRGAAGPLGAPSMSAQQERVFPVRTSSSCQVPATAQAYSLSYTVVPKGPLGYLTTWPTGQARPVVSTLNAPTGTITANAAIVPAGDNGDLSVYVTNDTDLIIDINGYFAPPASSGLSLYNLAPCRVYDSRMPGAQPIVNSTAVSVAGSTCSAPASAQSYIFNATVVPTNSLLFLTLWPHGAGEQPNASTLNAPDGAVTSNLAIVPTTDGSVSAFASHSTHLILDIFGYFAP
ncbi:MAG: BACON domain-containing protein [Bryobacteraceae bacterium]